MNSFFGTRNSIVDIYLEIDRKGKVRFRAAFNRVEGFHCPIVIPTVIVHLVYKGVLAYELDRFHRPRFETRKDY